MKETSANREIDKEPGVTHANDLGNILVPLHGMKW